MGGVPAPVTHFGGGAGIGGGGRSAGGPASGRCGGGAASWCCRSVGGVDRSPPGSGPMWAAAPLDADPSPGASGATPSPPGRNGGSGGSANRWVHRLAGDGSLAGPGGSDGSSSAPARGGEPVPECSWSTGWRRNGGSGGSANCWGHRPAELCCGPGSEGSSCRGRSGGRGSPSGTPMPGGVRAGTMPGSGGSAVRRNGGREGSGEAAEPAPGDGVHQSGRAGDGAVPPWGCVGVSVDGPEPVSTEASRAAGPGAVSGVPIPRPGGGASDVSSPDAGAGWLDTSASWCHLPDASRCRRHVHRWPSK